jgi:hypothetical protein
MPIVSRLTSTGTLLVNGTFDEVSLAAGAISFNGTSQYLTATSPNLSGTWTVEMWCYWTTGATQTTIVSFNNGSNSGINLWKNSSNQLVADDGVNGVVAMSTVTPTIGAWNHIAFVRVGTTTSGYVNGVLAGTTTYTPGTTSAVSVGRYNGSPFYYFPGYISNLRVVNGVAVYTSAFTPPQAILPAIPGTSLLLNVTDSTNFIRDNSTNNYTMTNNGTATFIATGPFNRGSTATAQRQLPDGTLEVYNQFDEVTGMVVTNGMIAYIDAGKPESYPGGGTTVRDLVNPDTNPATLNGTISYVSAGAASYWNIATGAATNYITSTLAQNYLDCTLVFYPDFTYNSGASLAMGLGAGISADKTMRFGGANGTGPWTLQNPGNTDDWASTATTYYVNNTAYTGAGSLASGWNIVGGLRTNTTNGAFASNFAYTWGTGFTGRYYQGRLAAIVLYNRQLTAAEQQNNYNYFAARYGLTPATTPPVKRESSNGTLYVNNQIDEFTGAPVVDGNLMVWVDAGQTSSYPGSGATWTDLSGNGKNYTLTNTPTYNSILGGGVITFAGASSQYATTATTLFNSTTYKTYTMNLWVYPTGAGNFVQVDGQTTPNTSYHYSAIEISAGGTISFGQWTGSMTTIATSTKSLNAWYNLVITYNGTTATAYVNGASVGSTNIIWSSPGANTFMALMAIDTTNMGTGAYASGSLGAFMVYNRGLTADEVTTNFNTLRSRYGI